MKKITIMVAFLFVVGIFGTALAANPFEFVPTGHWSYDSLEQLAESGVFAGYQEVHFRKNQTLTRYEMAVLVAKAIANENNVNSEQRMTIDKLAAEFKAELTNLGVNSANPAVNNPPTPTAANNLTLSGVYRIRYQTLKDNTLVANDFHSLYSMVKIDSSAKIIDEWTGNFSWEAYKNFYNDAGQSSATFASAWGSTGYTGANDLTLANVTGPIAGATMTIGKFQGTFGSGLIFDDYVTGAQIEFGKELKTKWIYAEADSNIEGNTIAGGYLNKLNKVTSVALNYNLSKATSLTSSFQNWTSKTSNVDSMRVYDLNVTSALNPDFSVYGTYDKTSSNNNNRAYVLGVSYKNADRNVAGSYGAFLDYENFEQNTAIDTTYWMSPGSKGFAGGFNYVPAKNIKWTNVFVCDKVLAGNNFGLNSSAEAEGATQKFFRSQLYFYF